MTPCAPFKQVDVFTDRALPRQSAGRGAGRRGPVRRGRCSTSPTGPTCRKPPSCCRRTQPGADYRVRIFCPGRELPFAGHPTLGSCHAWLEAGGRPRGEHVVQECGVGLVKIRRDGERLAFAAPPLRKSGPLAEADVALIARGLGVARSDIVGHAWCDNGPNWRGVLLRSRRAGAGAEAGRRRPGRPRRRRRRPARQGRRGRRARRAATTAPSRCAPSSPATTA